MSIVEFFKTKLKPHQHDYEQTAWYEVHEHGLKFSVGVYKCKYCDRMFYMDDRFVR
jgi:hypothetical protein